MAFNTYPCNPWPISTEQLNKGNNDDLNIRVSALEGEVSDLNDTKANQITIAPFFDLEASYEVGDLVYYNGLTYRCTNDHEGEWDADDFATTTIAGELDTLKSGLTNVKGITDYFKDLAVGESIILGGNHSGIVAWLGWNGLQARGEVALDPRILIRPSNTYSFTIDGAVNMVLPTTGDSINAASLVSSVVVGSSGEIELTFTSDPFGTANDVIVLIKTKIIMTRTA